MKVFFTRSFRHTRFFGSIFYILKLHICNIMASECYNLGELDHRSVPFRQLHLYLPPLPISHDNATSERTRPLMNEHRQIDSFYLSPFLLLKLTTFLIGTTTGCYRSWHTSTQVDLSPTVKSIPIFNRQRCTRCSDTRPRFDAILLC